MTQSWSNIIGHPRTIDLFQRGLASNSLGHAYLMVGPSQVGKGTTAKLLAQAVNCEDPNPPCKSCMHCQRIDRGIHPDIQEIRIEVSRTGTQSKEISIETIREMERTASLKPFEGKTRVFIVDGADHLSGEAANALLKTLEEPPATVMILLLAVQESDILPTLLSRCQRIAMGPIPEDEIRSYLNLVRKLPEDKALRLAKLSQGRIGWAIEAATDDAMLANHEQHLQRLISLVDKDIVERLSFAWTLQQQYHQDRKRVQNVLDTWLNVWRHILLLQMNTNPSTHDLDVEELLTIQARSITSTDVVNFMHRIMEATRQLSQNASPVIVLDNLLLHLPTIPLPATYQTKETGTRKN